MSNKPKYHKINSRLDDWLSKRRPSDFPSVSNDIAYPERYKIARRALYAIQKEAAAGALLNDIYSMMEKGRIDEDKVIYLNNHGPEHTETVIKRASELINTTGIVLTAYEVYLLLSAIQFHDIGNIFGREGHEKKCKEIMRELGNQFSEDTIEQLWIMRIAAVHGGVIGGDKDTISKLMDTTDILYQPKVRIRLLAALLRFADELADDSKRASRFMLKKNKLPKSSKIHHAYSSSLHSVIIDKYQIKLTFHLDTNDALKKYYKNGRDIYLLDEIYARTLKMHYEKIYCMQFLRPHVFIEQIFVQIEISSFEEDVFAAAEKINYSLRETGYPVSFCDEAQKICPITQDIGKICPDLKDYSGAQVAQRIKEKQGSI